MDLAASLEALEFGNDWLQSPLKQLTPFSTWSVCRGSSSNCFNWKEFSFHFSVQKTGQSQLWKQIFSIKLLKNPEILLGKSQAGQNELFHKS